MSPKTVLISRCTAKCGDRLISFGARRLSASAAFGIKGDGWWRRRLLRDQWELPRSTAPVLLESSHGRSDENDTPSSRLQKIHRSLGGTRSGPGSRHRGMLNASPTCCCRIATRERGSRPGACCRGFGRAGFGCGDGTASICFRDVLGFELSQKSSPRPPGDPSSASANPPYRAVSGTGTTSDRGARPTDNLQAALPKSSKSKGMQPIQFNS